MLSEIAIRFTFELYINIYICGHFGRNWNKCLQPTDSNILTAKRNATVELRHVRHVVYKHGVHEVTMTRTLSKALGLFEFTRHVG